MPDHRRSFLLSAALTGLIVVLAVALSIPSSFAQRRPGPARKPAASKPDPAPKGSETAPGPWSDPDDLSVWPNRTSHANSDPWLIQNHDRIRVMRPRVLLVNFSNEHTSEHLNTLTHDLITALAESSRYHGYKDPDAPVFLQYQVFKMIDLRDEDRRKGDSRKVPIKDPEAKTGFNMRYAAFFTDAFAREVGVRDPKNPKRYLRLDELVDRGYVHEIWFFGSGAPEDPHIGAFEVVEFKPVYDATFRRIEDRHVQAGNGGDPDQPWTGRSVRIGFINASRGIGCFLESLSHGLEGTANSDAIPYFRKYFRDYAGFDLDRRYKLPFDSLYAASFGDGEAVRYPDPHTMVVHHQGKDYRVDGYEAHGGNVHFPPNGRRHYDLDNDQPVLSTIEDWRIGSGPEGRDQARPWTNKAFARYRESAPDCMGPWLIYWRQNMPGLDNHQKDDNGRPMKNWWPFLFY